MTFKPLLLESTSCPRCGGSGRYGPMCVNAGICFKCGGRGAVLTKRGAIAQAWLNAQREVPVEEFRVGDRYFSQGFGAGSFVEPNRWIEITSIEEIDSSAVVNGVSVGKVFRISGKDVKRGSTFGLDTFRGQTLRRAMSNEARAELHARALAYQATLTKTGKPRKDFILELVGEAA